MRQVERALAELRSALLEELRYDLAGDRRRTKLETVTVGFDVRERRGPDVELAARVMNPMRVFRLCIEQKRAEGWHVRRVVCGNMPLTPGVEPMPASAFTALPHWAVEPSSSAELAEQLARIPVENILTCAAYPGLELRIELVHVPSLSLHADGSPPTVPEAPACWMLAHVPKHIG